MHNELMDNIIFQPQPEDWSGESRWFLFVDNHLLVSPGQSEDPFPVFDPRFVPELDGLEQHYLGQMNGLNCAAVALPDGAKVPGDLQPIHMRQLVMMLSAEQFSMVSRASQVLLWRRNHQFCSRCGKPTQADLVERSMVCHDCGYTQYPRISPCVIMLVTRGEEMLLGRAERFPDGMFSCLAGFMEPGETAEQAVAREVLEETGIRVGQVRYHSSQSWPFPHSLMLGFQADYAGGEIVLEDDEIVEANWYRPEQLPMIPPKGSIARTLIDNWCSTIRKESVK